MPDTRVYTLGARAPSTHAEEAGEQYYRANRYRNDICDAERKRRDAVAELLRQFFPDIERLEKEIAEADAAMDAIRTAIKTENAKERKRSVSAEQKESVKALRESRGKLYEQLKLAKAAAYGPDAVKDARKNFSKTRDRWRDDTRKRDVSEQPEVIAAKARVESAEAAWFGATPQARAFNAGMLAIESTHHAKMLDLRKNCGLHSGTYLAIEQATAGFRAGAPPKFKRYRGDGKIGVQLPNGGQKVRDVLDATQGQVSIVGYDPGDDRKQRATVRVRIGSEKDANGKRTRAPVWMDTPVTLHRAMPEDAKIKWAYLQRRRIGTQYVHKMNFTLEREAGKWAKPNRATRGFVGIDLGWRLVKGGLRIAYWVGNDGREGELILPEKLLANISRPDEIRSERDSAFNAIMPIFLEWFAAHRQVIPQWMIDRTHKKDEKDIPRFTASRWKSPAQLAALILQWRDNRMPGDDEIYPRLEAWRHYDKLQFNREAHGRDKAIGWRNEIQKVFADTLSREYRTAIIEKINWREMQEKPEAEESRDGVVGHYRTAAVGKLVECLKHSMGEIVERDPKDTSRIHHACGKMSGEGKPAGLYHTCQHCAATYDQDQNSAMNLLGEHLTPTAV